MGLAYKNAVLIWAKVQPKGWMAPSMCALCKNHAGSIDHLMCLLIEKVCRDV